jgi:hypothetical protein
MVCVCGGGFLPSTRYNSQIIKRISFKFGSGLKSLENASCCVLIQLDFGAKFPSTQQY